MHGKFTNFRQFDEIFVKMKSVNTNLCPQIHIVSHMGITFASKLYIQQICWKAVCVHYIGFSCQLKLEPRGLINRNPLQMSKYIRLLMGLQNATVKKEKPNFLLIAANNVCLTAR